MCSLINIFLIAMMVQSGLAYLRPIRCFVCDSTIHENCEHLRGLSYANRNLIEQQVIPHPQLYEECSLEKVNSSATTRRPYHEEKRTYYEEKRPYHDEKRTYYEEKRPYYEEKRPYYEEKKPYYDEKRPDHENRRPYHEEKKSLLFELSEANNYRPPNEIEIPMVCQTVIGTTDGKITTTIRRCQYKYIDSCYILKQKVGLRTVNGQIYRCEVCEENGCNGSSHHEGFDILIGLLATITIVFCKLVFLID